MSVSAPRALVIRVRFVEGRYHGEPEWPPSPARLFQALVAAAAANEQEGDPSGALRWFETLPPPTLAVPMATEGHTRKTYVPNNDLDAKGGNPASVGSIRTSKIIRPRIFDVSTPLVYAWPLEDPSSEDLAVSVCEIARGLCQLGRGIDAAHASGAILGPAELDSLLAEHPGELLRPGISASNRGARELRCTCPGSLTRLEERHQASLDRFGAEGSGRQRIRTFRQPPKPLFSMVPYENPPARALFELHPSKDMSRFAYTPATEIASLTECLRDAAAERLRGAMPEQETDIVRALVGRQIDGLPRIDADARIRLFPLPSIGSKHADRGVRRVLVDVAPAGPLRADDVFWAFSNLVFSNRHGSELRMTRSSDLRMTSHYGIGTKAGHLVWRTVTAAALPLRVEAARTGTDRAEVEGRVCKAVRRAIQHAGIRSPIEEIRVQREPFEKKGSPSRAYALGTRFSADQLWHVELTFREPIAGPLVIGNGRFVGLGFFAPVQVDPWPERVLAFEVISGCSDAPAAVVAGAFRRAVMSRFQRALSARTPLPPFVSGHEDDGNPTSQPHLSYVFDPGGQRLLVIIPPRSPPEHQNTLQQALDGFTWLRAGSAGCLDVQRVHPDGSDDPLLAPRCSWVSSTFYVVNHHRKAESAEEALRMDMEAACRERHLPTPRVTVLEARGVQGVGLTGRAELHFDVTVPGPLILGRTRHKGGGLFRHLD